VTTPAAERTFVGLPAPGLSRAGAGGHPCQGLYHTPAGGRPEVAFVATHYNIDFSEHYLAELLAKQGYGFLGWNTRFRGDEAHFLLDHALVDIGAGVRWLREEAGVQRVVLLGNSGGGSLMAAYQSNAVEPNFSPLPGMKPARGVDELLPADGFIALAAHPGRPDVLTAWMDAAVCDESDPTATDPGLDLWNNANGPPYDSAFVDRYRAAQLARNQRITDWAKGELSRLGAAGFSDRLFTIARLWADPRMVDSGLDPSRRQPNRCYLGDPHRANRSVWGVGQCATLRTWLSMWSLETSQCRAEPHLARVRVPSLVVSADADTGVFPSDAARIHDALGASDKRLVEASGDHYFLEPAGARDQVAELVAAWVAEKMR
jgi:pimeloyl-ACP methyl ester carboxylesterase